MATRRSHDDEEAAPPRRRPPATSPEQSENRMKALAVALAEKQLQDGTASAAVITHYLKLTTLQAQEELMKLRNENVLLQARAQNIAADGDIKKLYEEAIGAFRGYQPTAVEDEFLE